MSENDETVERVALLPCPFCGSANIDATGWASETTSGPACDDCGASAGSISDVLADNIAAWNARAAVAAMPERGEPVVERPRRHIQVTLEIGADTWGEVVGELRAKLEQVRNGGLSNSISGSPSSSCITTVSVDPAWTHDRYFAAIEQSPESAS